MGSLDSPPHATYTSLEEAARTYRHENGSSRGSNAFPSVESQIRQDEAELSSINLMCLSAVLLGAQLIWAIEFGYGTPFLLTLGLSKLVQIAVSKTLSSPLILVTDLALL